MNVIEVDSVSKMFRLGAHTGDLRDRFSALFAREQAASDRKAQEFWALQDVSFSVAQGESFGIIGHNGSGKSTMLKLITGIYRPTRGSFKTRGRIAALIEVGAGFHPDLTGRENVYLNGSVLGMSRREINRKFDEIVAFSEIEKFIDTPVKRYSSGMYMRLGFAIAANIDPDIVLVDEVLAVGDESFQAKCMAKMLELRAQGKTIVFISHNMGAVTELCDRGMLLSHGKLVGVGDLGELISTYRTMTALENAQRASAAAAPASVVPTREIKIKDVWLLDAAGRPCEGVASGDALTLNVSYRAEKRVDNPVLGMSLVREDGLLVYGFNTQYDGVPVSPIEPGEGRYGVQFHTLGLMPGRYRFNVDITHSDKNTPGIFPIIDARDRVVALDVALETRNEGVADLPHTWNVASRPAGPAEAPRARAADALAVADLV